MSYTSDPESFPEPIDLSHHLSRSTKAREASSVKRFYKYFSIPGIAQLAGGLLTHLLCAASNNSDEYSTSVRAYTLQAYPTTNTFLTIPSRLRQVANRSSMSVTDHC